MKKPDYYFLGPLLDETSYFLTNDRVTRDLPVLKPRKMRLARRATQMMAAWAVIGIVSGLNLGLAIEAEAGRLIAHIVAAIAVFSLYGLALGLFSERSLESLLSAGVGFAVGTLAAYDRVLSQDAAVQRGICLTAGGLVGATAWPCLRWAGVILRRLRTTFRSQRVELHPDHQRTARASQGPGVPAWISFPLHATPKSFEVPRRSGMEFDERDGRIAGAKIGNQSGGDSLRPSRHASIEAQGDPSSQLS
jgi:hypothetical protein